MDILARQVARRFELSKVAIALPADDGWWIYQGGTSDVAIDVDVLNTALAKARGTLEFDARQRAYGGHVRIGDAQSGVTIVPLRHGAQAMGLLAAVAPDLDLGTLDAVGGVVAIAIERTQFLGERDAAELVRQKADLAATLLASLSHDLKTPLTAVRVAVENLRGELAPGDRKAQADLAAAELARLSRLFQDILDMARVDAVGDCGRAPVGHRGGRRRRGAWPTSGTRSRDERSGSRPTRTWPIEIDPRLASGALSHLLENAAQYSPADRDDRRHRRGRVRRIARLGRGPRSGVSIPESSSTSSNGSIVAERPGNSHPARAWDWRSRVDCWPPPAAGCGPRTSPAPAPSSRWWYLAASRVPVSDRGAASG